MDVDDLVQHIRRVSELKHELLPPKLLLNRQIADAQVLIDADRDSQYPSASGNTVTFLGTEAPITYATVRELIDLYRSHRVDHFFVYLNPSQWFTNNARTLSEAGLTQFRGPAYHTLVRNMEAAIADAPCNFSIERLTPGSAIMLDAFDPLATLAVQRAEFDVWAAVSESSAVAFGMSTSTGEITCLGGAATAEPFRNHGAQSALIAARLRDAVNRGSKIAVSETLSMLGSSLHNLQRAGFEVAYDKVVYEYRTTSS